MMRYAIFLRFLTYMYQILSPGCKQPMVLFEIHKIGLQGNKNIQNGAKWPIITNPHFIYNIYKPVCLQNKIYFGIVLLASSTWLLRLTEVVM